MPALRRSKTISPITRRMSPRRMIRLVYKDPVPMGRAPSTDKERAIDELIRGVILDFDFTPMFSGDALRARLVATDIHNEIMSRARITSELEGSLFTPEDVKNRWNKVVGDQVESILAFKRRFSELLTKRQT